MSNRLRLVLFAVTGMALVAAALLLLRPQPRPALGRVAVASIQPLADLVGRVAGDRFTVRSLLPPGASPHTFEPQPAQLAMLGQATVFFRIGLGLELWADKLVASAAGGDLRVVTVSTGIDPIPVREGEHGEHADDEGAFNPHVWLDPVQAMVITRNVRDALTRLDPRGTEGYAARTEALLRDLAQLDRRYRDALGALAVRRVVVFHNAFDYLARRYDIDIVGVIEETPGREPGARHLATLIDRIRATGAAAVIAEPQLNPRVAEAIAGAAGVPVVILDPLGDPADPATMTYVGLMESNLRRLVAALSGAQP